MIITLDVPEDILCAVFTCVKGNRTSLNLYTKTLDINDLHERSVFYVGDIKQESVYYDQQKIKGEGTC